MSLRRERFDDDMIPSGRRDTRSDRVDETFLDRGSIPATHDQDQQACTDEKKALRLGNHRD